MVLRSSQWDELIQNGLITSAARTDSTSLEDLVNKGLLTPFQAAKINEGKLSDLLIGSYVLLDKLGVGGMGSVFKAKHRKMRRIAAIKILAPELLNSEEGQLRFQREIEVVARLCHPNVVQAYDAGECDAGQYLIMEFVDGTDLHHLVSRMGPLGWNEAIGYFRDAAKGLAYIHKQGLTHRDIKPANLLKSNMGGIKVTDLGLVRLQGSEDSPAKDEDVTASPLTMGISGTFDYMAPEQAEDTSGADHRADIYSLGCTLWFLLSGQHLYTERTLVAKVKAHASKPIPKLGQFAPGLGDKLEQWWNRMVAKQPENRHPDLDTALSDLDRVLGTHPPAPVAAPESNPEPKPPITPSVRPNFTPEEAPTVVGGAIDLAPPPILIVEPSGFQQGMIVKQLSEIGHKEIYKARSLANGLEAYFDSKPKIVVTSFVLPDGSGLQLFERIINEGDSAPPAFVLITSEADRESLQSQAGSGITILAKPFTKTSLAEAIEVACNNRPVCDGNSTILDSTSPSTKTVADWAQARVLVVDDSGFARKRMGAVFKSLGVQNITEAPDGAQAWTTLQKETFDFISTDCQMPNMSGDELIAKIRSDARHNHTGVVMITGETDPELLNRVRASGADEVLGKTVSDNAFKEVFQRIRPQWSAGAKA